MKWLFALLLAVLLAGCAAAPKEITVTLLYADEEFTGLQKEVRTVVLTDKGAQWDVLEALYQGPQEAGNIPLLGGTVEDILSVTTKNGLCTIDLSEEFVRQNTGGSTREGFILSSIVTALCSIDGIEQVKFNVEGDAAAEYGGHFSLDEPFSPAA